MSEGHRKIMVTLTTKPQTLVYTVWAADGTDALNRLSDVLGRELRDPRCEYAVATFLAEALPEYNAPARKSICADCNSSGVVPGPDDLSQCARCAGTGWLPCAPRP